MSFWHRINTRRYPWVAFMLTQACPGWGQIYNRDWPGLVAVTLISAVTALLCSIYLFDTLNKLFWAVGIGLVLSLVFSVQAFFKAKKVREIQRRPVDFMWWHFLFRLVCVYFLFGFFLYGLPDGYGKLFPSRINSFQIPSESMVPNLLVGDRLVADGWAYWGKDPQRGDIVVFDYPRDPSIKFVKRLIGVPGDTVEVKQGELFLNGKSVPQRRIMSDELGEWSVGAMRMTENLGGVEHTLQRLQPENTENYGPAVVPPDHYFMMGDNRDRSSDSRVWGYVKRDQIIGRMEYVFFSWDWDAYEKMRRENPADMMAALEAGLRWQRVGLKVK